jgi:uncharacterized protein (TIGR02271 family)
MFDTHAEAKAAQARLVDAGFASSAVTITGGEGSPSPSGAPAASAEPEKGAIARFFDGLFGDDSDRSEYAGTYQEAFHRGSYGVSVSTANDDELQRAEGILNDSGAVDIDERAQQWRKEGWTGRPVADVNSGTTQKLQEVEEELKVGKRAVARGGVRIFSRVVEEPVEESVHLREEHANVQRRAVDRPATEADFAAFKEGSLEIREMGEEVVVSKTARVTGEVEIGKTATEWVETVRDTVRKTEVVVEQIDGGKLRGSASTYAPDLQTSERDANPDPITGAPGSHPVGTGVGAVAGGLAAGAAAGSVAGPVGTVAGAAVGAVAGGLAGKGVAEAVEPTTHDEKPTKPL